MVNEDGQSVISEKGELVCRQPFPVMPLRFFGDTDGVKYRAAYFEHFQGMWAHGDFAERTERDGFIIYGRADATLNPGGVRIGTAEIYRQVEAIPEVLESLAIGQQVGEDVRVVLFVVLRDTLALTDDLCTIGNARAALLMAKKSVGHKYFRKYFKKCIFFR